MVAALRDELNEAATALLLPAVTGIIVLGSNGSWLVAAPAVDGDSALAMPLFAAATAAALAVAPAACVAPDAAATGPVSV
jgi:hypothetical protein